MQEQVGIKLVGKIVDEVGTYVDEAVVEEEARTAGAIPWSAATLDAITACTTCCALGQVLS